MATITKVQTPDGVTHNIGGGGGSTTYTLTKSGNTITLTGSGGDVSSVTDANTTYSLSISGDTLTLTPSSGSAQSVTIPDTDTTYTISISGSTITLTPSSGSAQTITIPDATTSSAGVMSASDKSKLDGIQSGAEVNVQSDWSQSDNTADDYIKNKPSLATVATTGDYDDLTNKPSLATVATTGDYDDLTNKPTIPTVNDATLTIQKNGTNVETFTANSSTNKTANITVPTKTSDLTNDSGFITTDEDTTYALSESNGTITLTGSDGSTTTAGVVTDVEVDGTSVVTNGVADVDLTGKQDTLVSGTNIKTINYNSILGSGNIDIQGGGASTPAGVIQMFAGSTEPTGWLFCDGRAVSRTTYATLYAALGGAASPYGQGDGSTTFNLPDFSGRMPIGVGESTADGHTAHTLGEADGKEAYKLTGAQSGVQDHNHVYYDYDSTYSFSTGYRTTTDHSHYAYTGSTVSRANHQRTTNGSGAKNATDDHTNMPPYLGVNFIISTGE